MPIPRHQVKNFSNFTHSDSNDSLEKGSNKLSSEKKAEKKRITTQVVELL